MPPIKYNVFRLMSHIYIYISILMETQYGTEKLGPFGEWFRYQGTSHLTDFPKEVLRLFVKQKAISHFVSEIQAKLKLFKEM